jgi:hypothetical protein
MQHRCSPLGCPNPLDIRNRQKAACTDKDQVGSPALSFFLSAASGNVSGVQSPARRAARPGGSAFGSFTPIWSTVPVQKVWETLVNPEAIRQYMFGTNVVSDRREGSPIIRMGE